MRQDLYRELLPTCLPTSSEGSKTDGPMLEEAFPSLIAIPRK